MKSIRPFEIIVVVLLMLVFGFGIATFDISWIGYGVLIPVGIAAGFFYLLRRAGKNPKTTLGKATRTVSKIGIVMSLLISILTIVAATLIIYALRDR